MPTLVVVFYHQHLNDTALTIDGKSLCNKGCKKYSVWTRCFVEAELLNSSPNHVTNGTASEEENTRNHHLHGRPRTKIDCWFQFGMLF